MKKPSLRLNPRSSLAFWLSLAVFLGWWFFTQQASRDITIHPQPVPADAHWITTADDRQFTACLRQEIELPTDVQAAHLYVTATGGFELICNGNPVGAQTLWRPTRHFQNGLTESGQRISQTEPIISYNFPREHQWSGHRNDRILIHFDLGPFLRKGKNTIALHLESRQAQPAAIAFGSLTLKGGKEIPLRTNLTWQAEPVPNETPRNDWSLATVSLPHWRKAILKKDPPSKDNLLSSIHPSLYATHQETHWIIAQDSETANSNDFHAEFDLPQITDPKSDPAWLKIISQSNYWLWVNGKRLNANRAKKRGFNGGEWFLSWEGRRPLATPAVLLDPDETSDFFGGYRYKDPRHGDPTENDFKKYENTANRTRERPNQTGADLLDDRPKPDPLDESKSRSPDPYGFLEEPNTAVPHTLLRPQNSAQYHGYDLSQLLQTGKNTLRVRLVDDRLDTYGGSQPLKFTVTGLAGETSLADLEWTLNNQSNTPAFRGQIVQPNERPALDYMGGYSRPLPWKFILVSMVLGLVLFYLLAPQLRFLKNPALTFSLTLLLALLLQFSYQERSEILFIHSTAWPLLALTVAAVLALLTTLLPRFRFPRLPALGTYSILLLLLLLTFALRAWNLENQPIDDDEYASIQAVLSIAETGKPTIANDIWYSRSPFYHYPAALFVKVFGPNIWALRLYSVLFAVMTGALLWYMARLYFKNTWTGHVALLIFALHPFLIFSGHIARFYQQQQFFVLLMMHLFIMGFLHKPSLWTRSGAIFVFALAVLSQEISLSFVPVFFILFLLFGRGVPFRWEVKSVLYLILAVTLVTADVALFQVKCLTRTVGVSPNVEATLAPTFWEIGNLFSMFIGYSRLHLFLSAFYLISFIYSIRRRSSLLLTLHISLLVSIIAFNFIITSQSFRYLYALIPFWILLGAHGLNVFGKWITVHLSHSHYDHYQNRRFSLLPWVGLAGVILSFSPWRILDSYDEKILGDPISSLAYVRDNLRPEDRVMITEPHPHAAKIELGRVDYDLVVPILYDFTYNDVDNGGALRDRNGNAIVVNRLANLQQIFTEQDRVWILLNREKFRSRKKNIRWEYPGAREELFIRQNCQLKYRSYLWSVYLWDKNQGNLKTFRKEPNGWVE